jgi:nucleotide-binding universal stress UspA family protein
VKKVLLSTDFSENAQHAIDYALSIFGDQDVNYFLLNSYYLIHNIPEMLISLEDILHEQSEKSLKNNLTNIKNAHHSLAIETISTYGEPAVAIKKVVKDRGIDMVVMGSQGSSALKETFFGSNTANLVKRISQPILIVPLHYVLKPPRKIIFATDLAQVEDLKVLEPMLLLARKYQSEIIIMNVTGRHSDLRIRRALDRLDFNNHFQGINYRFEVVQNEDTLAGISEFVAHELADMLVLSPKEYPSFKGMFHRSVTKKIIQRTEIPILVI